MARPQLSDADTSAPVYIPRRVINQIDDSIAKAKAQLQPGPQKPVGERMQAAERRKWLVARIESHFAEAT